MVPVTQATSCCRVVTVMRTGSAAADRLNDGGTQRRKQRRRYLAVQMLGRGRGRVHAGGEEDVANISRGEER